MKRELAQEIKTMEIQAGAVEVASPEQYQTAGNFLAAVKGLLTKVNEAFDPIIKTSHAAWKKAIEVKKEHEAPLLKAESIVNQRMVAFRQEEARIRRQEEDRLRAEAQAKAEKERAERAAEIAKTEGKRAAKAILATPVEIAPVVIEKPNLKVEGLQVRTIWKARVVDEMKIPREYLIVDMTKLNGVARSLREKFSVAGAEAYSEESIGRAGK